MIISDTNKFLFIHNPKAAGTSIRRQLFQYDSNPHRLAYQEYIPALERVVELFHVCAGDVPAVWPDRDFSNYMKFGFVRNPYDRLFSSWAEHKYQHNLDRDTDFNVWARQHMTASNLRFDWRYTHFCPQHFYFYKNNTKFADFIGRFEELDLHWAKLTVHLGIQRTELDHAKDQRKYDVGARLTVADLHEDVLRLVNRLYARDFLLFDYEMIGDAASPATHADIVDSMAIPLAGYQHEHDPRNLSLGEQCMYWRKRAEALERQ